MTLGEGILKNDKSAHDIFMRNTEPESIENAAIKYN